MNHNQSLFVLGLLSGDERSLDTRRNLLEIKECMVNIIGEYDESGLAPVYGYKDVKVARK